jgi:hypothetical protein
MSTQTLSVGPDPEIEVGHVGGDLAVEGWDRNEIEARGDDLHQVQQEGKSVNISCGGDLHLSVPRGSSLNLSYVSGDLNVEGVSGVVELCFIGGNAKLENLAGKVSVSGVMGDLQMKNVSNARVEPAQAGMSADLSERLRRKVEAATQRVQRQMERSLKQAERTARHGGHASYSFGAHFDKGRWKWNLAQDSGSIPSSDRVSDEERLAILKMLQEKKITSEEAEKLLAALEGGE